MPGGERSCRPDQVRLSLESFDAAAGHRFTQVVVRNTSADTCVLEGIPGIGVRGEWGKRFVPEVRPDDGPTGGVRSSVVEPGAEGPGGGRAGVDRRARRRAVGEGLAARRPGSPALRCRCRSPHASRTAPGRSTSACSPRSTSRRSFGVPDLFLRFLTVATARNRRNPPVGGYSCRPRR
ncbi:DUF4232 domain-containing protein [Nocardioides sp. W3-2-3]|nr:DUF4232 domain-containing protein [Nocardioides convexus]